MYPLLREQIPLLSILTMLVSAMMGDPDRSSLMNNDHPFDNFTIDNNSWLFEFLSKVLRSAVGMTHSFRSDL